MDIEMAFVGAGFVAGHAVAGGPVTAWQPQQPRKARQPRQKFTREEDERLAELVGQEKFPNWGEVGRQMAEKTARQCRERYQHYLTPGLSQDDWTEEEDALLLGLHRQHGSNWALIAKHFLGRRTNNHVKNRWHNHLRHERVPVGEGANASRDDFVEADDVFSLEFGALSFDAEWGF